jgi:hypothetical protein
MNRCRQNRGGMLVDFKERVKAGFLCQHDALLKIAVKFNCQDAK